MNGPGRQEGADRGIRCDRANRGIRRRGCTFDKVEAGWQVVSSALTVRGRVPGISAAVFNAAAEEARIGCPISQALIGNVAHAVEATLET